MHFTCVTRKLAFIALLLLQRKFSSFFQFAIFSLPLVLVFTYLHDMHFFCFKIRPSIESSNYFHIPFLLLSLLPIILIHCQENSITFSENVGKNLSIFENSEKVDSELVTELAEEPGSTANIMIIFTDGSTSVLDRFETLTFTTREDKITDLCASLVAHSLGIQAPLLELLTFGGIKHESFWINNQLYIPNANLQLVQIIATFPQVVWIRKEKIFPLIDPVKSISDHEPLVSIQADIPWNLAIIGSKCPSITQNGKEVVVANIDTGVRFTHRELFKSWRKFYAWYNPETKNANDTPFDDNGHGTHTMGSIVGETVGVAPGALWISCRGCLSDGCPENLLIYCGEWMLRPTLTDGSNPNSKMTPHVVSNSWGDLIPGIIYFFLGNDFYYDVIRSWRIAGIIPVFAIGNSGPPCFTASPPGSYDNVISVGATDKNDAVAYFSSRGPTLKNFSVSTKNESNCFKICIKKTLLTVCAVPEIQPKISAPGVSINSAWNTSDTSFNVISGTSMATPHVAGVIALMISENINNRKGNLTYTEVFDILTETADKPDIWSKGLLSILSDLLCNSFIRFGNYCGYPNNVYGYGRVNACAAVLRVRKKAANNPLSVSSTGAFDEL